MLLCNGHKIVAHNLTVLSAENKCRLTLRTQHFLNTNHTTVREARKPLHYFIPLAIFQFFFLSRPHSPSSRFNCCYCNLQCAVDAVSDILPQPLAAVILLGGDSGDRPRDSHQVWLEQKKHILEMGVCVGSLSEHSSNRRTNKRAICVGGHSMNLRCLLYASTPSRPLLLYDKGTHDIFFRSSKS